MSEKDFVRGEETDAAIKKAEDQKAANEADENFQAGIEEARAQMKAVLDGGLSVVKKDVATQQLDEAFLEIQKDMKKRFHGRLNSEEQNEHLALIMQGNRIHETFEIVPGHLTVKFQSLMDSEESFIRQIAMVNGSDIRTGKAVVPMFNEEWRKEMFLTFALVAVNDDPYKPISIDDMYKAEEDGKEISARKKVDELRLRSHEIRKRLPAFVSPTVYMALGIWVEYLKDLTSPKRVGNF